MSVITATSAADKDKLVSHEEWNEKEEKKKKEERRRRKKGQME